MNDAGKSKQQLIDELQSLRHKSKTNIPAQTNTEEQSLLETVANISSIILSHTHLNNLLDALTNEIIGTNLFRSLTVILVNSPTKNIQVVRRIHRGQKLNRDILTLPLTTENIVGVVARTNQMAIIEGWDDRFAIDIDISPEKHIQDSKNDVSYFIPIAQNNHVIAILATGSQKLDKQQTLDRINMLQPILGQLAMALRYAQLNEKSNQQAAQLTSQVATQTHTIETQDRFLQAMDRVGQAVLSSLDINDILDTISNQIIYAGLFRSLAVALVINDSVEIVRTLNPSKDGTINKEVRSLGKRYDIHANQVFSEVVRSGQMIMIDKENDKRLDQDLESFPWINKVAYFIPVKSIDQVLAVLAVASTQEQKTQTLQRIESIQPLLGQMAVALQNAQMHQEIIERSQLQ